MFEWQNRRVGKFVFTVTAKGGGDGEAVESRGVEFEFVAKRGADEAVLIAEGSHWLYLDTGEPSDEQWTGAGFDDAHWLEGPAQLGYGEGDEATRIRFGENPREKHVTTWFRKTITVEDVGRFDRLKLRLLSDDGALVFLNDHFVALESVGQVGLLFQSAPVFVLIRRSFTDEQGLGVRVFHAHPCDVG